MHRRKIALERECASCGSHELASPAAVSAYGYGLNDASTQDRAGARVCKLWISRARLACGRVGLRLRVKRCIDARSRWSESVQVVDLTSSPRLRPCRPSATG